MLNVMVEIYLFNSVSHDMRILRYRNIIRTAEKENYLAACVKRNGTNSTGNGKERAVIRDTVEAKGT